MTVIMLYLPGVPVSYQTMFTVPNIMLMNIMACRVFRNTKFEVFRENTFSTTCLKPTILEDKFTIPLSLTSTNATTGSHGRHGHGCQAKGRLLETTLGAEGVGVMKTAEYGCDSTSKYGDYPPTTAGDHNV